MEIYQKPNYPGHILFTHRRHWKELYDFLNSNQMSLVVMFVGTTEIGFSVDTKTLVYFRLKYM